MIPNPFVSGLHRSFQVRISSINPNRPGLFCTFYLFSWTPGGVFAKILQLNGYPIFVSGSLSSRDIAVWKKSCFLTLRCLEATLAPFARLPTYEIKAFLTDLVISRPNGIFFENERWFLRYLTYIEEKKENRNFHPSILPDQCLFMISFGGFNTAAIVG